VEESVLDGDVDGFQPRFDTEFFVEGGESAVGVAVGTAGRAGNDPYGFSGGEFV
jgi:hypothetical protein